MGNTPYVIRHQDADNVSRITFYLCTADADKPASGLNVGDLAWAVDAGRMYVADSATSFVEVIKDNLAINSFEIFAEFGLTANLQFRDSSSSIISALTIGGYSAITSMPNVAGTVTVVGASNNVAGYMSKINSTGQAAAIASTNLTNATRTGIYRISYFLRCTTADVTAGSITASFIYTDDIGATTDTTAAIVLTATTSRQAGSFVVYLNTGNITYLTTLVGIIGTSRYQLRVRCEYLG